MSDEFTTCPCCGKIASAAEIKPMPAKADLPACTHCRARVLVVGKHTDPFDVRQHQAAATAKRQELLDPESGA